VSGTWTTAVQYLELLFLFLKYAACSQCSRIAKTSFAFEKYRCVIFLFCIISCEKLANEKCRFFSYSAQFLVKNWQMKNRRDRVTISQTVEIRVCCRYLLPAAIYYDSMFDDETLVRMARMLTVTKKKSFAASGAAALTE
jgi:hypothetical protein